MCYNNTATLVRPSSWNVVWWNCIRHICARAYMADMVYMKYMCTCVLIISTRVVHSRRKQAHR